MTSLAARVGRVRRGGIGPFLELLGLSALAVAQPIFAVFGEGADIFVTYRVYRTDIVLFAVVVVLAVPLALFAVELLAGLIGERWRQLVHLSSIFALLVALAMQVLKRETDLGWKRLLAFSLLLALVGALAVWRWQVPRLFLRFLSLAPVAFAALFLVASPAAALALPSASGDAADVHVGNPAPVLWITLDELPLTSLLGPDHKIDAGLFPNFARLASDATLYRNHTTVAPNTTQAVPALLTGRNPRDVDDLPVSSEHDQSLFTLLAGTYRLNASEGWTDLCPPALCEDAFRSRSDGVWPLLGEALDVWRQRTGPTREVRQWDAHTNIFKNRQEQVREFIASLDDDGHGGVGRPRLDFLHVVLPHSHFELLPTGQHYEAPFPRGSLVGSWVDEGVAAAARQRHLLQVQYTDRLLGQILDRISSLRRYDPSLIVVTADHGAAFTPGSPFRKATPANYHEIMWPPLIIKAPGQRRGVIDDTAVRSVDVVPTVAELLDVRLPWAVDGRAIRPGRSDGDPHLFRSADNQLDQGDSDFVRVDGEEGFRRVLDAPPPRSSDDDLGVYRLGPYGDLVGQDVGRLPRGTPVSMPGRISGGAERDVDLEGSELQAYLTGQVVVPGPDPILAVAVNGVIAGWSQGYLPTWFPPGFDASYLEQPRPRRWWTMVPPTLLRDGENHVELLRIDGPPGAEVLRPVRLR